MTEPEFLTPDQVADKLQMNADVVRRMLIAGKLPGRKVGRIWRTSAQSLREFIDGGEKAPANTKGAEEEVKQLGARSGRPKTAATKKKPAAPKGK